MIRLLRIFGMLMIAAGAIINVRFVTSQVMAGAAELLAYGTAVKIKTLE